jgi:hypothetical protein
MWEPRRLKALWAPTASYRESCTFILRCVVAQDVLHKDLCRNLNTVPFRDRNDGKWGVEEGMFSFSRAVEKEYHLAESNLYSNPILHPCSEKQIKHLL